MHSLILNSRQELHASTAFRHGERRGGQRNIDKARARGGHDQSARLQSAL